MASVLVTACHSAANLILDQQLWAASARDPLRAELRMITKASSLRAIHLLITHTCPRAGTAQATLLIKANETTFSSCAVEGCQPQASILQWFIFFPSNVSLIIRPSWHNTVSKQSFCYSCKSVPVSHLPFGLLGYFWNHLLNFGSKILKNSKICCYSTGNQIECSGQRIHLSYCVSPKSLLCRNLKSFEFLSFYLSKCWHPRARSWGNTQLTQNQSRKVVSSPFSLSKMSALADCYRYI